MKVRNDMLRLKDSCRENLAAYSARAFSLIPVIEKPSILDLACGTGVPAMVLAGLTDGSIVAIDIDRESLNLFREKIAAAGLGDRIRIIHGSVGEDLPGDLLFDIIWAEGIFNIVGFKKGLSIARRHVKPRGHLVIHDDPNNRESKMEMLKKNGFALKKSFALDADTWRKDYCDCLELKTSLYMKEHGTALSDSDAYREIKMEIENCKNDPASFQSVFYIAQLTDPA
jgi:cyclopropane fatty-acyl-phospholipid synthase-like methyltransferase